MRKSFDGLSARVRNHLGEDPLDGHLYVFINRRRTQLRILYFDRSGYVVWAKRLEAGQFCLPAAGEIKRELSLAELQCLLEGIDIRDASRRKRFSLARASHTRRKFIDAQASEPDAVAEALAMIRTLYHHETSIREQQLDGEKKREYRLTQSKPIVDALFEWAQDRQRQMALLPRDPFSRALKYLMERSIGLRVFLEDPDVPLDTNHVERTLRCIPMGRKNWHFCWSELGARHVGIIQSLISTCRLQGINPHVYLIDVLQRVGQHPASRVEELTPRLWKTRFADNPLGSDIDTAVQQRS